MGSLPCAAARSVIIPSTARLRLPEPPGTALKILVYDGQGCWL